MKREGMYRRLVVPGRFQPVHFGHISIIEQALGLAEEVIVVIGSAQESFSTRNPLTAGERMEMLDIALKWRLGEDYRKRVIIVPVQDIAMNKVWVQYLRMLLPAFDGVISGNELVLALFEDMGLAAVRPNLYKREQCSGTNIRKKVISGDESWKECVPAPVLDFLRQVGFERRLRRLAEGEG